MVDLPCMVLSEHDVQTAVDFEIPQSPVVLKLTSLPLTSSRPSFFSFSSFHSLSPQSLNSDWFTELSVSAFSLKRQISNRTLSLAKYSEHTLIRKHADMHSLGWHIRSYGVYLLYNLLESVWSFLGSTCFSSRTIFLSTSNGAFLLTVCPVCPCSDLYWFHPTVVMNVAGLKEWDRTPFPALHIPEIFIALWRMWHEQRDRDQSFSVITFAGSWVCYLWMSLGAEISVCVYLNFFCRQVSGWYERSSTHRR